MLAATGIGDAVGMSSTTPVSVCTDFQDTVFGASSGATNPQAVRHMMKKRHPIFLIMMGVPFCTLLEHHHQIQHHHYAVWGLVASSLISVSMQLYQIVEQCGKDSAPNLPFQYNLLQIGIIVETAYNTKEQLSSMLQCLRMHIGIAKGARNSSFYLVCRKRKYTIMLAMQRTSQ